MPVLPRYDLGRHVALSASAGSGKTYTLTLRLLKLLLAGTPPERILCTTFTNKATHEMAERLLRRIEELAAIDPGGADPATLDDDLAGAVAILAGHDGTPSKGLTARVGAAARSLRGTLLARYARLHIVTMDSFFNTVLRLFPFEASVPPDFDMLNEARENAVFSEAMDRLVGRIAASPDAGRVFDGLILSLSRTETTPEGLLRRYFDDLSAARVEVDRLAARRWPEGLDLAEAVRRVRASDAAAATLVAGCRAFGAAASTHGEGLSPTARRMIGRCLDAESPDEVFDLTVFSRANYRDYRTFAKLPDTTALQGAFEQVRRTMPVFLAARSRAAVYGLLLLFRWFTDAADRIKREAGCFGFSDVERLVHNLLVAPPGDGVDAPAGDRDFFYYRLDARLKHLLMDEFQDTNTVQWRILRPVITEITADREGSFFYVGDPKQAIYRFRGGESGLFEHVRASLSDRIVDDRLPRNYRSARAVVEFVNRVFDPLSRAGAYTFSPQVPHRRDRGYAEFRLVEPPEGGDAADCLDGQAVARIARLRDRGVAPARMAVLMPDNKGCVRIADALVASGCPAVTETRTSLFENFSVAALKALLHYLADPGDEPALCAFLSSRPDLLPARRLEAVRHARTSRRFRVLERVAPDVADRLRAIRSRVDFRSPRRILLMILRRFSPWPRPADRANLLRLADRAGGLTGPVRGGLFRLLEEFERFGAAEPGAAEIVPDAVQVLTVHKAKGLEFDIVILPQIEKTFSFNKKTSNFMLPMDPNFHLTGIHLTPAKREEGHLEELDAVLRGERERNRIDALNLLYVALTRARTGLYVIASAPKPVSSGRGRSAGDVVWRDLLIDALVPEDGTACFALGDEDELAPDAPSPSAAAASRASATDAVDEDPGRKAGDDFSLPLPVASQAEAGPAEEALEDPFSQVEPLQRHRAIRFGEAFHEAMEHLVPGLDVETACRAALARYGCFMEDTERDRLVAAVGEVAADPELRRCLTADRVYTELPVREADTGASLRIDVLAVAPGVVTVIDYKTGYRENLLSAYRAQVERYMAAVRPLFPDHDIRGRLVFAGLGRVLKVQGADG